MKKEIRLCGFGGQGIITAGVIVGKSASVYSNYNAVQTQSYGPEARGGASKSEVIISDEEIGYPGIEKADILVVMSQQAWDRYGKTSKPNSTIVIDPDMVKIERGGKKIYEVRATKIASDLGNKIIANMVMLGALVGITGIVPKDAMEQAILDSVPKRFVGLNKHAFAEGFKHGVRELDKQG
ncbi:MAG TPA: 2-oxoacid:ferredoxin oxidoreductase subunit gamma [Thermoplasmata archaeon]|nr:2-oxoacid:ferredoxin oxidoreductase subunit gamma [Thermoplasmata archaeon]